MGVATAVGAAASVAGGLMAKKSAGDAAEAQVQGTQAGIAEQRRQYDQTRKDLTPWRRAGGRSINTLAGLLGLNTMSRPEAPRREDFYNTSPSGGSAAGSRNMGSGWGDGIPGTADDFRVALARSKLGNNVETLYPNISQSRTFDSAGYNQAMDEYRQSLEAYENYEPSGMLLDEFGLDDFEEDPGYRFRLSEGEKGIDRAAAARGGYDSGATLKALMRFNQNTASNEFQNAFNRDATYKDRVYNYLTGVSEAGRGAQGTVAQMGSQTAGTISNLYGRQGDAQAAGLVGGANAMSQGLSGAYDIYNQNRIMNQVFNNNRGSWVPPTNAGMGNWSPY